MELLNFIHKKNETMIFTAEVVPKGRDRLIHQYETTTFFGNANNAHGESPFSNILFTTPSSSHLFFTSSSNNLE